MLRQQDITIAQSGDNREAKKALARERFSSLKEGDTVVCFYPNKNNPPVERKVLAVDKLSNSCESGVRVQLEGIESWLDSHWIKK
jgi:hypothetical protein